MLDRERILARIDVLDGYLRELRAIVPATFEEYTTIEKRRACEGLLRVSGECVIDISSLLVTGLGLGLPAEEDDLLEKLTQAGIISHSMRETLRRLKGLRNILVHEYGRIDDRIVYEVIQNRLDDFEAFKREILQALQ